MIYKIYKRLRREEANSLVENVIILPMLFIIIYFMILMGFIMHDRTVLDSAAKRGTIYAARCVSDPNYTDILQKSGHAKGSLDTNVETFNSDSFSEVGRNIEPYRYINLSTADIESDTQAEVYNIIQNTKIPWREIQQGDIVVDIENKVIYQNVKVSITAKYPMPDIFGAFGLPTEFEYTVDATTAVNDPDEFIRNVDFIIDMCVEIDQKTGGHISELTEKIGAMATKVLEFMEIDN